MIQQIKSKIFIKKVNFLSFFPIPNGFSLISQALKSGRSVLDDIAINAFFALYQTVL